MPESWHSRAASGGVCGISSALKSLTLTSLEWGARHALFWEWLQHVPKHTENFYFLFNTTKKPSFVLAKSRPGMEFVPCSNSGEEKLWMIKKIREQRSAGVAWSDVLLEAGLPLRLEEVTQVLSWWVFGISKACDSTTDSVTGYVQCPTKADKSAGNTSVSACGLYFCLFVPVVHWSDWNQIQI